MPGLPRVTVDLSRYLEEFRLLFDRHHEGVLITNIDSTIIYYNDRQGAIDEMDPDYVIGRSICDVFNITPDESPTIRVLRTGQAVSDSVHFYLTRYGKLVNSSCHIYPIIKDDRLLGALSFVQSYARMGELMEVASHKPIPFDGIQKTPRTSVRTAQGRPQVYYTFANLIGNNPALLEAVTIAKQAARSHSAIMLVGETGVGKEIFAQSIHNHSQRRDQLYTAINCSAMPETLLEGILFGTTKGSFTGAIDKPGLFEVSSGGTVFLDEVDSMPVSLQSKLLRVLQEKRVRRVGGLEERDVDIKIISAVGQHPETSLARGILRPDFYYRLGVVKVFIPPLRERTDDMYRLVAYFMKKHSEAMGVSPPQFSERVMHYLKDYHWPGNVRELEHILEACFNMLEPGQSIRLAHLKKACPECFRKAGALVDSAGIERLEKLGNGLMQFGENNNGKKSRSGGTFTVGLSEKLRELEYTCLIQALTRTGGHHARTARLLQVSPQALQYKMKKYQIAIENFSPDKA